jgi:uncharacterized protein (DUF697 family)
MKKLPKAVRRTADEMRRSASVAEIIHIRDTTVSETAPTRAPSPQKDREHSPAVPHAPSTRVSATGDAASRAWRERLARGIVDRHAAYAGISGMVPVPLVNAAGITAVMVRMVKCLSQHYNTPFEQDRARSIVIGLAMGVFPTGLGAVTSSGLLAFLPGANAIGLAVSSAAAATCTRSIGRLFIEHFENGSTLADIPVLSGRSVR